MAGRGAATTGPAGGRPAMAGAGGVALGAMIWGPRRSICGIIRRGAFGCCEWGVATGALGAAAAGATGATGVDCDGVAAGGGAAEGVTAGRVTTTPGRGGVATAGRCGGGATAGRVCACCSACLRSRIAFSASPGLEIFERSILGSLVAAAERAPLDGAPPRRYVRTRSASSSSSELECVFFSVTPTAVKASRIDLLLTSSSRARSLIRTLLIRPLFATPCRLSRSYAASTLRDV